MKTDKALPYDVLDERQGDPTQHWQILLGVGRASLDLPLTSFM